MTHAARRNWQDLAIRIVVSLWFCALAALYLHRMISGLVQPVDDLARVRFISQACLVLFFAVIMCATLLREQPLAKAPGWRPRAAAMLGGYLVWALPFLPPADLGLPGQSISATLMLSSDALALFVLLNLGRSFSIMAEARRLVTDGPYAVVRHPLYLAEQIGVFGVFMQVASWQALVIVAAHFYFQLERMRNEEAVLAQAFPEYAAYARRTARLIPALW